MSTICVTDHNEHICKLVQEPFSIVGARASPGCPSYVSKYRRKIVREQRKVKECHKTFGFAVEPVPRPCEFLRKNSRIVLHKAAGHKQKSQKCRLTCRKPALPPCAVVRCAPEPCPEEETEQENESKVPEEETEKKSEDTGDEAEKKSKLPEEVTEKKPKVPPCTKNFIAENIHRAVHSVPKQPKAKFVDTNRGNTQLLITSGLLPTYIHKKNYGQVPGFVSSVRGPVSSVCAPQEVGKKPAAQAICEAERVKLLEGLRHNWAELQKAYQLLPVLTDTLYRRVRKQCMEKELRQLEHDIRTIERHAHIYVVDDGSV